MAAINSTMFDTPNRGNQSSNINQLTPDWVNIAYQVNDSLLAGGESVKVDALLSILNLTSSYSQSDKLSSGYSVNILAQQSAKTLADVSAKIYANQSPKFTGNQSGEYFSGYKSADILRYSNLSHSKRGEFTPLAKVDFSHLSKEANYPHWQDLSGVTTQGRIEFCQPIKKGEIELLDTIKKERIEFLQSIKKGSQSATLGNVDIEYRASENYENSIHLVIGKGNNLELIQKCAIHHLRLWVIVGYSKNALAKSSVRICTLNPYKATHDAPSVFFCVYAYAYLRFAVLYRPNSMVMLAGQPKGWLVSLYASSANPVSVTTPIEICTSGGDSLAQYKEIIVMMATPTQTQFKFLFLSIKRSDTTAKPCRIAVTAPNENSARLMLVRDYMLIFAGRLPAQEVAHA
ncbi:host cell division inhibitor Icd-like protein [Providencia rettgeri]|uniref:host cell division inhibitor Icd-like protein n=1 Tax=Providencia rettgeri TaxID=587 RepID=UPI00257380B8|nr:host cell division inhibitor Icd-like protein [Providencia rettgeri]MDL9986231.1 host cell division inhibitor Icd-like protein [Providencia rettgeri]